jgi:hypothetical protein
MTIKRGNMKKNQRLKKGDRHYVSNKEFLEDIKYYKELCKKAEAEGKPKPRLTDEIGKKIMLIANRVAFKPNFINYSFRDEMIDDAIENCITYADNFDPEKGSNPFAYFTQICHFAFIRRIQKEKTQFLTKVKYVQQSTAVIEELTTQSHDARTDFSNGYRDYLRGFYDVELPEEKEKERKKRTTKSTSVDLEEVMTDE